MINPVAVSSDPKLKQAIDLYNEIFVLVNQAGQKSDLYRNKEVQGRIQELFALVTDPMDVSTLDHRGAKHFYRVLELVRNQVFSTRQISQPDAEEFRKHVLGWPPSLPAVVVAFGLIRNLISLGVSIDIDYIRPGVDSVKKNGWLKFYNAYHDLIIAL